MSTEVEFNPFRPDGELSKEAENIIKNSTILRDRVIINDPSLKRPENGVPASMESPPKAGNGNAQKYEDSPIRTGEVVAGQVPPVTQAASSNEAESPVVQVERVKIKSGPSKCCLIQ
ncbi:unnamed protein product [Rodentolepis nana]|uniref:Uncharacterized protein n=1 Tax=Rodentolepis nana TaxID=102285 RepID=A0A0R3T3V6_RODNA|nr:unnamed protein product [Rodentolepis nana]